MVWAVPQPQPTATATAAWPPPAGLDYNWASVVVLELGQPECSDADRISTAHGWAGALNFEAAARTLHGVEIDYDAQEIYMTAMPGVGGAREHARVCRPV